MTFGPFGRAIDNIDVSNNNTISIPHMGPSNQSCEASAFDSEVTSEIAQNTKYG